MMLVCTSGKVNQPNMASHSLPFVWKFIVCEIN